MATGAAVRQFKQRRSAQTYEALLEAASRIFAERGYDGAQAFDIAAAAGVSTGAFYRYFRDKLQCLVEMLDAHLTRERANVRAQLSADRFVGTDRRAALEMVIDVLFDSVTRNVGIARVYISTSLAIPEVAALRASAEGEDRVVLARLIATLIPREVIPSPEAAATVLQIAGLEVAADRAGLRPQAGPAVDDGDVKVALRQMLERYLFSGMSDAPEPSPKRAKKKK